MLAYLNLTKPRISLLFALSGFAAAAMEGSMVHDPTRLALITVAIFLVGGSANSFNQYFERDIDAKMGRTAKKRPLPLGQITPGAALIFSIVIGALGTTILLLWGGWLSGVLGLGTILFYSLYYTLWLKPRTPYNIVIGGIAGAAAPLIAWAAATGRVGWTAFLLFLIIFFWTPPHFWSLALCCKEDYRKVGYPMLPLAVGDEATRRQILVYSFSLPLLSLGLTAFHPLGRGYLAMAILLNIGFLWHAWELYRKKTLATSWRLFGFSIAYLLLLFIAIIGDAIIV